MKAIITGRVLMCELTMTMKKWLRKESPQKMVITAEFEVQGQSHVVQLLVPPEAFPIESIGRGKAVTLTVEI